MTSLSSNILSISVWWGKEYHYNSQTWMAAAFGLIVFALLQIENIPEKYIRWFVTFEEWGSGSCDRINKNKWKEILLNTF